MEDLRLKLEGLSVTVSQAEDGRLTACSNSEPLFCVVRDTEAEIEAVVVDTLASYLRHFYNLPDVVIHVETKPVIAKIPVEKHRPVRRLLPNFGAMFNPDCQLATA